MHVPDKANMVWSNMNQKQKEPLYHDNSIYLGQSQNTDPGNERWQGKKRLVRWICLDYFLFLGHNTPDAHKSKEERLILQVLEVSVIVSWLQGWVALHRDITENNSSWGDRQKAVRWSSNKPPYKPVGQCHPHGVGLPVVHVQDYDKLISGLM